MPPLTAINEMNFLEKALERLWLGCGGHCHTHGPDGHSCPLLDGADPAKHLLDPEVRRFSSGPSLVLACLAVFLLPLSTAVGGGFLAGRYLAPDASAFLGWWQAAGLLGGLAVGVGLAKLLVTHFGFKKTLSGGGQQ